MADNGQFSDAEEIVCDVPTTAEEATHITTTNSQTTDNNNITNNNITSDNNNITSDKTNYAEHGENRLNGETVENVDYYEEEWYEEEER